MGGGDPRHRRPGLLIAGAFAAWVPDCFRQELFLTGHPWPSLWGPLIGPLIAMLGFVCSIGNVPLAAVLRTGGISFGGVVSFLFADLIIIPILIIYRKYYGTAMAPRSSGSSTWPWSAGTSSSSCSAGSAHLAERTAKVTATGIQWNYTTVLNIIFLLLAAALLVRFFRSGGGPMLKMMGGSPDLKHHQHAHAPSARHAQDAHGGAAGHERSAPG